MAVQTYLVGVFFCIGLISGLIINSMMIGFNSVVHLNTQYVRDSANDTRTTHVIIGNTSGGERLIHRPPVSHEEIDRLPGLDHVVEFNDHEHHKGK